MSDKVFPTTDSLEDPASAYGLRIDQTRRLLANGQVPLHRDRFLSLVRATQERLRGRPQVDSVTMVRELRSEAIVRRRRPYSSTIVIECPAR